MNQFKFEDYFGYDLSLKRISVLFACFNNFKSMQDLHWIKYKFISKNKFLSKSFILCEKQLIFLKINRLNCTSVKLIDWIG